MGPLFWRGFCHGRLRRDFLGSSFSVSDDELLDEGGLAPPSGMEYEAGRGFEGVIWFTESDSNDAMMAK